MTEQRGHIQTGSAFDDVDWDSIGRAAADLEKLARTACDLLQATLFVRLDGSARMNQIVPIRPDQPAIKIPRGIAVPATIAAAGEHAARRFLEFFAATIRNKNTRMAYYRAVTEFFAWVEQHKIGSISSRSTSLPMSRRSAPGWPSPR